MADYTKTTNFAIKDSLSSGDPNKVVKGSEIDTEFDNIQTSNNSKMDASRFPNISGDVTASHTELNILDGASLSTAELNVLNGYTGGTSDLENIANNWSETTLELGGDFAAGDKVKIERYGNLVIITSLGSINYTVSTGAGEAFAGNSIPSEFRPTNITGGVVFADINSVDLITVFPSGTLEMVSLSWNRSHQVSGYSPNIYLSFAYTVDN